MVRSFLNVSAFLNYSEAHFFGVTCHIGHIMRTQKTPEGKPHSRTIFAGAAPGMVCDRGYAATREQAIADFEAEWLRLSVLKTKKSPETKAVGGSTTHTRPEGYAARSYHPSCFQNVNTFHC